MSVSFFVWSFYLVSYALLHQEQYRVCCQTQIVHSVVVSK